MQMYHAARASDRFEPNLADAARRIADRNWHKPSVRLVPDQLLKQSMTPSNFPQVIFHNALLQ